MTASVCLDSHTEVAFRYCVARRPTGTASAFGLVEMNDFAVFLSVFGHAVITICHKLFPECQTQRTHKFVTQVSKRACVQASTYNVRSLRSVSIFAESSNGLPRHAMHLQHASHACDAVTDIAVPCSVFAVRVKTSANIRQHLRLCKFLFAEEKIPNATASRHAYSLANHVLHWETNACLS